MAGGFLGVDVFFVISGYLIHRDLVGRLAARRLSVLAFYGRRLRRTLPALYVAALLSAVASVFVLLPGDLEALARSLLRRARERAKPPSSCRRSAISTPMPRPSRCSTPGASGSRNSSTSWRRCSPWRCARCRRAAAPERLAVDPSRSPSRSRSLLQRMAPAAAFYLMPARIFEFLLGAVLAEDWLPRVRRRWAGESLAAVALAALLFSFVGFDAALPHPGWPTLVPCLATAVLIHCGVKPMTAHGCRRAAVDLAARRDRAHLVLALSLPLADPGAGPLRLPADGAALAPRRSGPARGPVVRLLSLRRAAVPGGGLGLAPACAVAAAGHRRGARRVLRADAGARRSAGPLPAGRRLARGLCRLPRPQAVPRGAVLHHLA